MQRPSAIGLFFVLSGLAGLAAAAEPSSEEASAVAGELVEVPEAPLDAMETVVREAFEKRRAAVRESAAREPADPRRLAAAYAALGELYLAYNMPVAAESCFANAHHLDGGDYRWAYYLAAVLANERPDQAAALLERTLELRPGYPPALLRLGDSHLERNQPVEAAARFDLALSAGERYAAAAFYGKGRAAAVEGDFARAADLFEEALARQSRAGAVHHALGLAYRELGELDKARTHLRQGSQVRPSFPDPLLQRLVAEGAAAHMLRGLSAFERGDFESAVAHHRKAVEADPDNPVMHKELAESLLGAGQTDEAIGHFREVLHLDPGSPVAHLALGAALARTEDGLEEALELAGEAVALAPNYADAHLFLGYRLESRGEYRDALAFYDRVVEIAPDDRRGRRGRARCRGLMGQVAAARQELVELVELDPKDFETVLDLTTLLARSGASEAAVRRLEAVLSQDLDAPARALGHFNLANLLRQEGDLVAAADHYREAARHDPEFKDAHFNLATLLGKTGHAREAAASFARVIELDPGDAQAYGGRARAWIDGGRPDLARSDLEKSLELDPENVAFTHALARLLAASPDEAVRDGSRALELAMRAVDEEPSVSHAETVAMALAELGRFREAVRWQEQVLAQARRAAAPEATLERLEANLSLYSENKPYRGF